jgi:hypothetical protein
MMGKQCTIFNTLKPLLLIALFLSSICLSSGQSLLPDCGVEEYDECPVNLVMTTVHWEPYRGSPDYFHECCGSPGINCPTDNLFGHQDPYDGEGYFGLVTYFPNLPNAREWVVSDFLEPMEIGETYHISFRLNLAYNYDFDSQMASNNIGFTLITENYLDTDEQGELPNSGTFNIDTLVTDTANWIPVSTTIVADSAYTRIVFGNFYDDLQTDSVNLNPLADDGSIVAYYFFDGFCVTTDPEICCPTLNSEARGQRKEELLLWPNPAHDELNVESEVPIHSYRIFDVSGGKVEAVRLKKLSTAFSIPLELGEGLYIILLEGEGYIRKERFLIK